MEENNIDKVQDTPNPQAGVEQNPAIAPIPPQPTEMVKPPEIIKPKKNFKTLLLIILVLFLLAASGYFVYSQGYLNKLIATPTPQPTATSIPSPSPNPTADWKTYTNQEYGFILKYPSGVYIKEGVEGKVIFIDTQPINIPVAWGMAQLTPVEIGSPEKVLLDSYINTLKGGLLTSSVIQKPLDEPLSGYRIDGILGPGPGEGSNHTVVVIQLPNSANLLSIDYNHSQNFSEDLFDQILSTFKFLDKDEAQDIEQAVINHSYNLYQEKYKKDQFRAKITKTEGDFSIGTVNITDGPGWVWIAKKINNNWQIIWSGQEVPLCSDINKYSVPKSISSCN